MVRKSLLSLGLGLSLALGSFVATAHAADIVDTAVSAGSFKTLASALKAADLITVLKGKGPFTVFAPTDAAFAKVPKATLDSLLKPENKAKLVKVLTYHVVPSKVLAKDIKSGLVKTVEGSTVDLKLEDGKVEVGNAYVTKADIIADNGVIHVIDAVLLPPDL